MSDGLESLAPAAAVDMYLSANPFGVTDGTLQGHKYRLRAFLQWCDEYGTEDLRELSGRDLYRYRIWRQDGDGEGRQPIKQVTLRGQLATLRVFLRFCADIDAVPPDLFDTVSLPNVEAGDDVSDSTFEPDRVLKTLEYLETYEYASREHVTLQVLWRTGCRTGGVRALDLRDLDLDGSHPELSGPGVHFVHRPSSSTPLKNKEDGTRWNRIDEYTAQVLGDYIGGPRIDSTDDAGRQPLLTTNSGRPVTSTVRDTLYRVSRPCWIGESCPHDRDPESCEATNAAKMSNCPSKRSPHDVRSGRVTYLRREETPRRIVEDELDASDRILDRHYDRRSQREKAAQRADYLPDI
jgi:integrase